MAKNQLAKNEEQLPLHTGDDYADRFAGEETYVDREHTITPRISILQGLSPQCKRNNVGYIEGAKPGDIYVSSFHKPIINGDEGIIFQPALFQTPWEVRTPKTDSQAANYVDAFDEPQPTWTARKSDKGFLYYVTPEGNVASQVHVHIGLAHVDGAVLPYAIKFSGTGMFISKQWNGLIGSRRTDSGKPAARFTYTYKMKVKSQTNAFGEWGQWSIAPYGKATLDEMQMAHDLVEAFRSGERTVERDAPGEVHDHGQDDAM